MHWACFFFCFFLSLPLQSFSHSATILHISIIPSVFSCSVARQASINPCWPKYLFMTWNYCYAANKSHMYLVTESIYIQQIITNEVQFHISKPSGLKLPRCFCVYIDVFIYLPFWFELPSSTGFENFKLDFSFIYFRTSLLSAISLQELEGPIRSTWETLPASFITTESLFNRLIFDRHFNCCTSLNVPLWRSAGVLVDPGGVCVNVNESPGG